MTEDEIRKELEELQSHPMFMTEVPENAEENVYLQAIQALKYEGKPEDVAREFMEKSKEALEAYKQKNKFSSLKESMYYICNAIDHVKDDSTVPDQIKYDLFFYRSQLQIMVKNIGYAIEDLKSALFYVEDEDGYLLLIECYIALDGFDRALKLIQTRKKKLTELDKKDMLFLYTNEEEKIKSQKHEILERLHKLEAFKNMENDEKMKLYDDLTKIGIKLKPQVHNIPPNVEAKIYQDEDRKFHFPALIIYEEFNATDYIQDLESNALVADILEILMGEPGSRLPWDKENKYNINTCACFYEISDFDPILKKELNYYFPLRNDDKLIDILTHSKVYMSGFPVLVVVSKLSNFYAHFIKNKLVIKRK